MSHVWVALHFFLCSAIVVCGIGFVHILNSCSILNEDLYLRFQRQAVFCWAFGTSMLITLLIRLTHKSLTCGWRRLLAYFFRLGVVGVIFSLPFWMWWTEYILATILGLMLCSMVLDLLISKHRRRLHKYYSNRHLHVSISEDHGPFLQPAHEHR